MTVKGRSIVVGGGLFCTTATLLLRMSRVTFPWPACPAAPAAASASLPAETHTANAIGIPTLSHHRQAASRVRQLPGSGHGFGRSLRVPRLAAEESMGGIDCMSSCLASVETVACRLLESLEPITTAHHGIDCCTQ